MKRSAACLFLLAAATLPVLACRDSRKVESGKVEAVVTVLPHQWLVEQVGGEHVAVTTMVRPGESAEMYQPTDAQISQVMAANVYFRTGMPLEEGPGFQAIRRSGKVRVVDLRDGVALREMQQHSHHEEEDGHDHDHGDAHDHASESPMGKDPHIWLSPKLLKVQAKTAADALSEVDPAHREDYQRNLAALVERLDELDQQIRETLKSHRDKAFFVFHPAWGYFADEYGLRQIAIETEGKEPSDRELTALQQQARQEGVKVIFIQQQTAGGSAKAIAQAVGARTEYLHDLPEDLPESLLRTARLLAESYQ